MKKYTLLSLLALLLCVSGCKTEPDYSDAVYMTGTLTSSNVKFLVEGQSTLGLTVTSTDKTDTDVKVGVQVAPQLLESLMPLPVVTAKCLPKVVIVLKVVKW